MDYIYDSETTERKTVYISENALDKIIVELVQSEMKRLGTVETLLPRLETKKNDCLKTYHKQIICHQRTIIQLQAELSDLYASFSLNRSEREVYLSQKKEIIAKIETISQEIALCETSIKQVKVEEEHSQQVSWVKHLAKFQNQSL